MPSQDHTHSFSQEYGQYQPQTAQHQEYYNNGGYDYQHQQQQQYDPSTENYSENYLQPQDQSAPEQQPQVTEPERINDPLNRHLGCPLIAFGFGGKVTTWFAQGNGALGPLKMQRISDVIPKDTAIASYPGPLLMDSSVQLMAKRNHVMKFVEDKINEFSQSPDGHVHDAHRVLVWKLLKVMLEQEGTLTGGTRIDEAVRGVLRSIPLTNLPQEAVQQKTSEQETASTDALQELLRQGDLAASIRYAIDSRLWAHALVLSSHGDRELWNEAVSGFMNQELSAASGHANGRESMRVLYTLLSGQSERAVSQLVPQNLRTQYLETKDDLSKRVEIPDQSLTQWRDTLILILSNRTEGDQGTINALGNLLRKEGWVEAAHICYLLSPQVSVHSGSDDSNSSMVLLGVENDPHAAYPFYGNVSAFQKTEIYEFGRALKSSGATGGLPFFQAYKLIYSWRLLDVGMLSEAARYLESMENIMKSQTKGSPYYNSTLFAQLKELTERMAASVHNAGPWLSKKVPSPVVGSIFDGSEKTSVESDTSSHDHASRGIAETEVFSVEQRADVDSVFARETSAVTQEQTGQHSDATHGFDTLVQQQHDFGHQHQDAGYHDATQDQAYNQQHVSPFTSEHHSETTAVPSMLSTQAVAGSENLSPNDLHETAPDHQIQDAGFDGSYSQYPSNPGYDQQDGAAYGNHEYQGQHQHLQHDDGSHGHAYGETLTYESTQYPPQEDPYNQAQSTNAVDELFGTGYNEASTQVLPEHYPAEDLSQQQVAHEHEPTHVDTTTTSEQPVAQLQTENSTETGQHYWTQDQSYQHGEATHGEGHAVEGQDNSHGGPDHGQAAYHEQQGLEYDQHKDTEFQQQHQAGYQHGDYQQGGEHQQGEYQQGEHQQGEYQQGEYQQ
ncbi:vesicle coat component, partial [Mortierella sp. GBA43]